MNRERSLAVLGAALFAVSTAFPIAASLSRMEKPPTWIGVVDVGIAGALMIVAFVTMARGGARVDERVKVVSYRAYRASSNVLPLLLAAFFLLGDRLKWDVLVIGLAWRAWVLWCVLPAWLSLWQGGERT
jgi:hypothetical protein